MWSGDGNLEDVPVSGDPTYTHDSATGYALSHWADTVLVPRTCRLFWYIEAGDEHPPLYAGVIGVNSARHAATVSHRRQQTLVSTLAGFETCLQRHMPSGVYRDFCCWAISAENMYQDVFLQTMGMTQLVNMTVTLLDGLVDDQVWPQVVPYCAAINTYQIFEIMSDNVAMGLARRVPGDVTAPLRHAILSAFNQAAIQRLHGVTTPAVHLLDSVRPLTHHISLFEQSLTGPAHQMLADAYLGQHPQHARADLEYSLWSVLVTNLEACMDLTQHIAGSQVRGLVQAGLVGRYHAVNHLLEAQELTLAQQAESGAYTILVIPALAYYIGVLVDMVCPNPALVQVIADGTLGSALYDAALLVRLLNDIGTTLVTLPLDDQGVLIDRLRARVQEPATAQQPVAEIFVAFADEYPLLTRIAKDIVFGEFNVALSHLTHEQSGLQVVQMFQTNLAYYSQLYRARYDHLLQMLARLTDCLHDDVVSQLLLRFVQFHAHVYSNPYTMTMGEYAI